MVNYIIRRLLYSIPIIISVNVLTFFLFFVVNTPDDMARLHLGEKRVSPKDIEQWKEQRALNYPLFYNTKEDHIIKKFTKTIFFQRSIKMIFFDYGTSETGENISNEIQKRIIPSLTLQIPIFILSLFLNIFFAMYLAYNRGNLKDKIGMFLCIIGMSISPLFYIIIIQVIMGKWLKLLPISGFQYGIDSIPFIIMPILVALVASMGQEVRFYRTIFLEEIKKDYITTAQSKGISQKMILFIHVLKNAMIPILTGVVITIPFLFVGSLLLESFFCYTGFRILPFKCHTKTRFCYCTSHGIFRIFPIYHRSFINRY